MVAQQFCLRWNNHHVNMLDVFDTLYNSELLVDVTLACEGVSIKAHKVVLSACSSFFQEIFTNNPCKHPVVILKGMKLEELRAVLQFMYRGEVNVTQEQLPSLVKAAESLRVKGLAEMNSNQFEPSNFNTHEPLRDKVHKTQRIHNSSIHNSAIHNSSMRNSVQEPETVSPSTSNCGDQQDVLTDDNQSEKNVSKMSDESSKDGTNETNQSNSHPQLSALLDSSSMKKQPASPMSDTGEDDGYMAHHEYLHQDNSENSSFVGNDEDRPGDTPNHYPLGLKISGLSHSPSVDIISAQDDHFLRLSGQQGDENLYQQWRSKRKRYKRYTQETLENAIFAVMQGSLSQKRAAVIYGIPHETLRRHVKDRKDISNPHTILIDSSPSNGIDDVSIMENGSDKMDIKITNEAMSEAISINIESKPSGSCSP